ncbi:MAG: hypothetical protein ACLQPH_02655 [Acidimicrobiales bacterium]
MTTADDQHPIEAFAPDSADEALGEGVGTRSTDGYADDPDALGAEDLIEGSRELGIPVTDQELDRSSTFCEFVGQVPGLLNDPGSGRVFRDARDVNLQGVELDEEQDVELSEKDSVGGEEVARQHGRGLGLQELLPARPSSAGGWIKVVALEDIPDARSSQVDAHDGEFAVDPAVSPSRVLPGQADDQAHCAGRGRRSARHLRVGPLPLDQLPVPAQQGVGLHEEAMELGTGQQPAETGEKSPVRRAKCWTDYLAAEDRYLMSKHDDLDGQIGVVTASETEQLQGPKEGEIQE